MMFKKTMFPTDFSLASNNIYSCIPSLKKFGLKEAILVHIVDEREDKRVLDRTKMAKDILDKYKDEFEDKDLKVKVIVKPGIPFLELNNVSKEEDITLTVITSHGKSMIEKMFLGSVTEKFVYNSTKPVLIEKVNILEYEDNLNICNIVIKNTFKNVLFPTDWSECSNEVFESLKGFKKYGTESVTVLHVMDDRLYKYHSKDKRLEFEKIELDKLMKASKELGESGLNVNTMLTWGIPFNEIKRAARDSDISLVAMGVHGGGTLKNVLLGSTAERVARFAFKPVLLLSHKVG